MAYHRFVKETPMIHGNKAVAGHRTAKQSA